MKQDIHPQYNQLTVKFPSGESFATFSSASNAELYVDVDFRKHPAWTKHGVIEANASSAKVVAFNKKFSGLNFSGSAGK